MKSSKIKAKILNEANINKCDDIVQMAVGSQMVDKTYSFMDGNPKEWCSLIIQGGHISCSCAD
jgi:hypothetical protein